MADWIETLKALKNSGNLPDGEDFINKEPDSNLTSSPKSSKHCKLQVVIDKKGRKGKTATIIEGFECSEKEIEEIATTLKKKLGTGGSVRDGEILIQGDRKEDVIRILKELGF